MTKEVEGEKLLPTTGYSFSDAPGRRRIELTPLKPGTVVEIKGRNALGLFVTFFDPEGDGHQVSTSWSGGDIVITETLPDHKYNLKTISADGVHLTAFNVDRFAIEPKKTNPGSPTEE